MSDYLDEFDLTVSTLWREERLSCPHRDVMQAYADGELPQDRCEYIGFHLEEVGCTSCRALLADLGAPAPVAAPQESAAERALRERLLKSTSAFLTASRASRRR